MWYLVVELPMPSSKKVRSGRRPDGISVVYDAEERDATNYARGAAALKDHFTEVLGCIPGNVRFDRQFLKECIKGCEEDILERFSIAIVK